MRNLFISTAVVASLAGCIPHQSPPQGSDLVDEQIAQSANTISLAQQRLHQTSPSPPVVPTAPVVPAAPVIAAAPFTPLPPISVPQKPAGISDKPMGASVPAVALPAADKAPTPVVVGAQAVAVNPATPVSGSSNATTVASAQVAQAPKVPSTTGSKPAPGPNENFAANVVKLPAPALKPLKTFVVSPQDKTFRETLAKWAPPEGWTFIPQGHDYWTPKDDIDVVGSATFHGDFKDAVRKLMSSTELTKTPMQPCFHNANQALRIILINEECEPRNSQSGKP